MKITRAMVLVSTFVLLPACSAPAPTPVLPTTSTPIPATATLTSVPPTNTPTAAPPTNTPTNTPKLTPTPKPSTTPKPAEIVQPPLLRNVPTYGHPTDVADLPNMTILNAERAFAELSGFPDQAGVVTYHLWHFPSEDVYKNATEHPTTGITGQGITVENFKKAFVFSVESAGFTGETRADGAQIFIVRFKTNVNGLEVTANLRLDTHQKVLTNIPEPWKWQFYQVPGATADPGLFRWARPDGQKDAAGVTMPDQILYYLNQATPDNPHVVIPGDLFPDLEVMTFFN